MGNKYVVKAFVFLDDEYQYVESYRGESLFKAIYDMWLCKQDGAGCVVLEWR